MDICFSMSFYKFKNHEISWVGIENRESEVYILKMENMKLGEFFYLNLKIIKILEKVLKIRKVQLIFKNMWNKKI